MHSAILLLRSLDSRYSLRQKLVSVILTNVPDNGIVAIKMSITQLKLRGINNRPVCFSPCAQEQHNIVHCPVRHRSWDRTKYASWRKGALWLNACWWNRYQKVIHYRPLFPPPENKEILSWA